MICTVLVGMGLPSAVANVACRFLVDFLVAIAGGVIFWFCRFGEGEVFSSDIDDQSSSFSALFVGSISVWRLIPLGVCNFLIGFPTVRFPNAFLFVGLTLLVPWLCADFSCIVSFIWSPVVVSFLNMGCCGACGSFMSKKRKHGHVLRADL